MVDAGFDINVRDPQGMTPLLKALSHPQSMFNITYSLSYERYIKTLLDNNADPHLTVMHEGREINALELASNNPSIQRMIRERMEN